jgi:hypothetical protein
LTVGTLSSGTIYPGMLLTGGSILPNTYIVANQSGSGSGSTWTVSVSQNLASTNLTGTIAVPVYEAGWDHVVPGTTIQPLLDATSGYIIEPAGVLSLCALDNNSEIKGKNIVCIISGGNSDVFRMPDILEQSLVYEGLKHYFKIDFAQRAGSLKTFILKVLAPSDDIIYFRYTRSINKETAPVVIGLQVRTKDDINRIMANMESNNFRFKKLDGLGEE